MESSGTAIRAAAHLDFPSDLVELAEFARGFLGVGLQLASGGADVGLGLFFFFADSVFRTGRSCGGFFPGGPFFPVVFLPEVDFLPDVVFLRGESFDFFEGEEVASVPGADFS